MVENKLGKERPAKKGTCHGSFVGSKFEYHKLPETSYLLVGLMIQFQQLLTYTAGKCDSSAIRRQAQTAHSDPYNAFN